MANSFAHGSNDVANAIGKQAEEVFWLLPTQKKELLAC